MPFAGGDEKADDWRGPCAVVRAAAAVALDPDDCFAEAGSLEWRLDRLVPACVANEPATAACKASFLQVVVAADDGDSS